MSERAGFKPVKSVRLYQRIVEQIEASIGRGDLKPGQHLPSERELMAEFGTSRSTVREALRVLENDGRVASRPGDKNGPLLLPFSTQTLARHMQRLASVNETGLAQLISSRMVFESGTVRLAAVLHTAEELSEIQGALDRMREAIPEDPDGFGEADLAFHEAIARSSRNHFMEVSTEVMREVVLGLVADSLNHSEDTEEFMRKSLSAHELIFAAVQQRDGAAAAARTRKMLFDYYSPHVPPRDQAMLRALLDS